MILVWGVGPSTAEQWYYQGMRTLDDLRITDRKETNFLNRHQKIGLELFEDLDERMTRSEAADIEAYVRKSILEIDKQFEIIACGSFRRGKGKENCARSISDVNTQQYGPKSLKNCLLLQQKPSICF